LIAALFVISTSVASALSIDLNIVEVTTDGPGGTLLADLVIAPDGNSATTALLAAGQFVGLNIIVDNSEGAQIAGIFLSIVTSGPQMDLLGATVVAPAILMGSTGFPPPSLGNVGSGFVKVNSPTVFPAPGDPDGELWVQGLAFGSGDGSNGTGPDNAITLYYQITGASGSDTIIFELRQTAGDGIEGDFSSLLLSGASINIPEPGTALLMGLGLIGLAVAGRRQS
jgi:hypothetical protein